MLRSLFLHAKGFLSMWEGPRSWRGHQPRVSFYESSVLNSPPPESWAWMSSVHFSLILWFFLFVLKWNQEENPIQSVHVLAEVSFLYPYLNYKNSFGIVSSKPNKKLHSWSTSKLHAGFILTFIFTSLCLILPLSLFLSNPYLKGWNITFSQILRWFKEGW